MRILIAPDKFKGALDAREVAENIARGITGVLRGVRIDILPMADGGDGTAAVISDALGGSWLACKAHDPLGRKIEARYAWVDNRKLAVMEMSEAAGMRRLSANELDPERANTLGVGEMILDAAKRGSTKIIVGLGGSATNDGGFGMAKAIGFKFFDQGGNGIERHPDLSSLARIEFPRTLSLPKIIAAVDVRNPLLGENGATCVFGPQKGATADKIAILERALVKLADVVAKQSGSDYRNDPGAGAAGGLGFGLMTFCSAQIRPGFELVAELAGLESKMREADLVITGEGSLDRQTLSGKTPFGVAQLARKLGKRVVSMVGRASGEREVRDLFDKIYVVSDAQLPEAENIARAAEFLRAAGGELAKSFNI
ncbi:MAG TPA: glycerate kinase [Chthoniobacterales bacterium]|nr:glycerate kinase [Chthoniobacterales bacterium]HXY60982.1 glycerate kinase [Chthoniobacterales bacterium]